MKRSYSIPTTRIAHIESMMLMAGVSGGGIAGINNNEPPEGGLPIPPSVGR